MNASLTETFVSVSDFSQGKANKIFNDVSKNNREYVVLKNNRPSAVVVSAYQYENTQKRLKALAMLLEQISENQLLEKAVARAKTKMLDFSKVVEQEGFDMDELKALSECVEIE